MTATSAAPRTDRARRRRQTDRAQGLLAERPRPAAPVGGSPPQRQHPLELILARNLAASITLPAVLVDASSRIVYFNAAASTIAGGSFQEIGTMTSAEWNRRHGPLDSDGEPIPVDDLPLAIAVRDGQPAFDSFRIRGDQGTLDVQAGAIPLTGSGGYHGAMVVFWIVKPA
jgi:PAS domain-containing protein